MSIGNVLARPRADRFLANLGWLGSAQLVNRVFRLATTVVLARLLSPTDYGLAAIVLTTNEFVTVFTRSGVGQQLIKADEADLPILADTAYWLNWILCGGLFLIQCAVGLVMGLFYSNQIPAPICAMACIYLVLPFALVQTTLIARENRLKVYAVITAVQLSTDCVLTIIFALLGWGMWAVILPKVLVSPIWVYFNLKECSWRPPKQFTLVNWRQIANFGRHVLGVELLTTLRANVDNLLVAQFLGVQALGVYFFAFNAGLGISMSILGAFSTAIYPFLCEVGNDRVQMNARFLRSLRTAAMVAIPLILLQSGGAPFYVPIVFGQKWVTSGAVPVLILICLSALPRPFAEAASQLLRARNLPHLDLSWNLVFTAILILALLVGSTGGILGVAIAVFATHAICLPLYTFWAYRRAFA
jgi:teichuronic acid exporter